MKDAIVRCECGEKLNVSTPSGVQAKVVDSVCYNCNDVVVRWHYGIVSWIMEGVNVDEVVSSANYVDVQDVRDWAE